MQDDDAPAPVPAGPDSGGDSAGTRAAERAAWGDLRRKVLRRLLPLAVLAISMAAGWAGAYAVLRPMLGQPARFKASVSAAGARAEARVEGPAEVEWISDQQAVLTWHVTNTGDAPWAVDLYRFDPETPGSQVIPVPRTLQPGASATLRAIISPPPGAGVWAPAWNLYGPRGRVEGGRLTASVPRRPDSSAGE